MEKIIKYVVGIDVAKDKFDVCLMSVNSEIESKVKATRKFGNTVAGFKEFIAWINKHNKDQSQVQLLMEATGVYHENLAITLVSKGLTVFVVLPNKSKRYMQALGLKTKNDSVDAKGLALMCISHQFKKWKPICKYYYELRLLTRHYQRIQELRTSFKNQLHALEYSGYDSKIVIKQLKQSVKTIEKQLLDLKKDLAKHIASNHEVHKKSENLRTIKGVDTLTIATILAETNGFELFNNQSQLVSYAGYDVVENQSGNRVGKTKISKKGSNRIRRILHMPALVTVKYEEKIFKNLYTRVYEKSKIKMKGYVAVQKKLLIVMYTLWKNETVYNPMHEEIQTSRDDETKPSFLLNSEGEKVVQLKVALH
jgi:transposase